MIEHDLLTDSGDDGVLFRDVIMLGLAGFVAMVILLLPHLHPPGEKADADHKEPPNEVIEEIRWPDKSDSDVDLWVEAPGDVPVGYSNKGSKIFNLLRDDLGKTSDALEMNYETSRSRGIPPGEYTVNVHLYRLGHEPLPITVTVVTSVKKGTGRANQILVSKVKLVREGQELTVYRFKLDPEGNLVPGSVHSLQKPLRTWRK